MSIWAIFTLVSDLFKLKSLASYFWQKHEATEARNAVSKVVQLSDSAVLARLRSTYSRD